MIDQLITSNKLQILYNRLRIVVKFHSTWSTSTYSYNGNKTSLVTHYTNQSRATAFRKGEGDEVEVELRWTLTKKSARLIL